MEMSETPFITVVVPVRNEEPYIGATLSMLLAQDWPADRLEILVADGMSTDATAEKVRQMAAKDPRVRLLENRRKLSSAGRNLGFAQGRGDVFVVVDGHCHVEGDGLFRSIAACLQKSGAACLGRPQPLDPPGISEFQQAVAAARASALGHGRGSYIYSKHEGFISPVSNGAVYLRRVVEALDGVDESFDACEDVEYNLRVEKAGFSAYMSPDLTVKYFPRESLGGLWRQMVRYGRGRARLNAKHPETGSAASLAPLVFVAGLLVLLLVSLFSHTGLALLLAALGFYGAVVAAFSIFLGAQKGPRFTATLIPVFFVIHAGLGWGMLSERLARRLFRRRAAS
ncbi:MAG: glycosyltransferase family 2 protein [Thermodesulfobacteriota bacterium]